MQCAEGAPDPGTAQREQAGLSVRPHCLFHTTHCRLPRHRASVQKHTCQTPPSPMPEEAVKERGMGLACCSWAVCSPWPKAPESPELVAVILDDDLESVVPKLSSQEQVLVLEIFHLLPEHIVVQLQLI